MSYVADAFSNSSLRLIVMPTEKCNYRCSYCYEDFLIGRMSNVIVDSLSSFISNKVPTLKNIDISWFGGEPLLAFDVIESVMLRAVRDCQKHDVSITSGMSTNGHLLSENVFRKSVEMGLSTFQITLDGDEFFHNRRRRLKSKLGNFEAIVCNMYGMCRTDFNFSLHLRVHVDKINADSIVPMLKKLKTITWDRRTKVSFERVKYLGEKLPDDIVPMSKAEFAKFVGEIVTEDDLGGIIFDDVLEKVDEHVCYASLPNNFVVRADGRLQKCTVALKNDFNTIGKLLDDGRLSINDQYEKWLSVWFSGDSAAIACPAKKLLSV